MSVRLLLIIKSRVPASHFQISSALFLSPVLWLSKPSDNSMLESFSEETSDNVSDAHMPLRPFSSREEPEYLVLLIPNCSLNRTNAWSKDCPVQGMVK